MCLNILQHIRNECGNYDYTCNESKKPQNKNLNRYRDVAPYDHTRIILKRGVCDYIHANLIQVNMLRKKVFAYKSGKYISYLCIRWIVPVGNIS